jgi:hypothetical protein
VSKRASHVNSLLGFESTISQNLGLKPRVPNLGF